MLGLPRRAVVGRWVAMLVGALAAALVLLLLLMRLPDAGVLGDAGALCASTTRLAWGAAERGADLFVLHERVGRDYEHLKAAAEAGGFGMPALAAFGERWSALAPLPAPQAAQALAEAADAVAEALRDAVLERQRATERALKTLTVALAATLLLPIHGLWRQRQRMRASLRGFSDQLGSGDWHGAVRQLREDERAGAPSAFDALASGLEDVLGESDRRWRALADLSADWYWETDTQHRFTWMSPASPLAGMPSWTGRDLANADGAGALEPPALGWEHLHERLRRREPFRDIEFRTAGRPGSAPAEPMWVSISGRPRFDAAGRFSGYEGVGHDITDRKTAHERLVASEQRWSLMAGLASDWYWQTDAQHRVLPLAPEFARRAPELAEYSVGRTRWESHPRALTPEQWAEHRADLEAHRPFRGLQFEAEIGAGRYLWLSISGIPRFDGQGRFLGYHGVGRDITVRKQAERLLMRHNDELQRAVAARTRELEHLNHDLDAFSRQLAHELRTPIGHIEGLAHLLEVRCAGRLHADERQLLDLQVQAARGMRETLEALMQLARSTVQAMPMEDLDLSAIAAQVAAELPPLERRAAVEWRIAPGLRAHAAPAAIRIVFANLLGNAAKFTRQVEAPRVTVSATRDADGRLRVRVEDNGAGFEPAQAARLFVPFSRLHGGEEFHGTGIGLTIVQRIVERHGGSVAAHGEPGRGAAFEFTLAPAADSR